MDHVIITKVQVEPGDEVGMVMAQFAQRFVSPPVVSVNQLLVEM